MEKLQPDLQAATKRRSDLAHSMHELDELRKTIGVLRNFSTAGAAGGGKANKYKQLVDLGAEHYVVAEATNTEFIFLEIGLGFFLQVTLDEAPALIDQQQEVLEKCVVVVPLLRIDLWGGSAGEVHAREWTVRVVSGSRSRRMTGLRAGANGSLLAGTAKSQRRTPRWRTSRITFKRCVHCARGGTAYRIERVSQKGRRQAGWPPPAPPLHSGNCNAERITAASAATRCCASCVRTQVQSVLLQLHTLESLS